MLPSALLLAEPPALLATHLPNFLLHCTPDATVGVLTLGIGLIFFECNRPGSILPGATGLLLVLLAAARLDTLPLTGWAVGLLTVGAAVLLLNLWYLLPWWLLGLATAGQCVALRFLVRLEGGGAETPIHTWTALLCGGLIGVFAAMLSRIALRARRAKAVH